MWLANLASASVFAMTQPEPDSHPDVEALASIDLSGPETAPQAVGRVASGLFVLILGVAIGLGSLFLYVGGFFFSWVPEWLLLEDLLMWPAVIGLGIAITGFTVMTRTRRQRAREAAEQAVYFAESRASSKSRPIGDDYNPNRIPPKNPAPQDPPTRI